MIKSLLILLTLTVLAQAAPKTCPTNEVYLDCGSPCQTECSTLGKPCLIQNIRCPDGCYCVKGHARNASGQCIPQAQCSK